MSASGFTQIRRGPMGGDHYTQIHNGVFRDRNLTPNAKAIFGWISTHTEKWEIGIAAIAEAMGMGRPAARTAVALLKERHYLVYGQERNPDGTKGQAWYFVTDLPAQLAAAGVIDDAIVDKTVHAALEQWLEEKARSAPGCGFEYPGDSEVSSQVGTGMRFTGYPVEPHAVPGPPKKNNVLPEEHQVQDFQARSKENIAPTSPSTRSVDAEFDADAESKAEADDGAADGASSEAWVQPGQDEEDGRDRHGSTTDPAVGIESSAPDDLGGGGAGGAARPGQTLDEEYPYCTGWEDQRIERLLDHVAEQVSLRDLGLVGAGYLDPVEESMVFGMLDRFGNHPEKIINTVLKRRDDLCNATAPGVERVPEVVQAWVDSYRVTGSHPTASGRGEVGRDAKGLLAAGNELGLVLAGARYAGARCDRDLARACIAVSGRGNGHRSGRGRVAAPLDDSAYEGSRRDVGWQDLGPLDPAEESLAVEMVARGDSVWTIANSISERRTVGCVT